MKKLAVVLTALMMLSTTTFLAAGSSVAGVTPVTSGVTVTESEVTTSEAKEVVAAKLGKDTKYVTVVELDGNVPADGKVTLVVDGVKDGDSIAALHFYEGNWVKRSAKVVKGEVVIDFKGAKHFSPVIIVKVPASSSVEEMVAIGAVPALPKTGAVAVLPVAAMACLAGAVVCGRKEK